MSRAGWPGRPSHLKGWNEAESAVAARGSRAPSQGCRIREADHEGRRRHARICRQVEARRDKRLDQIRSSRVSRRSNAIELTRWSRVLDFGLRSLVLGLWS